jgi:hypothetical protein
METVLLCGKDHPERMNTERRNGKFTLVKRQYIKIVSIVLKSFEAHNIISTVESSICVANDLFR